MRRNRRRMRFKKHHNLVAMVAEDLVRVKDQRLVRSKILYDLYYSGWRPPKDVLDNYTPRHWKSPELLTMRDALREIQKV